MSEAVSVRRAHRMPFGAEVREDGTTRFRIWAPGARSVELWLEEPPRAFPMVRDSGGWAEFTTREAPPGARYRFRIDGQILVPDPASRFQPEDVHGPSEVVDPLAHGWTDTHWAGIPSSRLVFYELHVGTFTGAGTFAGIAERLDHLASLGITAVELMPVGDFPGRWGWGYDGVLPFAPDSRYGRPEQLKALVEACHAHGLAAFLDVVYNHFGPEGNYLHRYAPDFFSARHRTPWGDGLNFDGPGSEVVRAFMVHNALYWIEEFHLDGLRLDAVHAMRDDSDSHLLIELGGAVAAGPGRQRPVHLVLENDGNEARFLARDESGRPRYFQAQWNDDLHHTLHVLLTGERSGYYADYDPPLPALGRCLAEGFTYQGEPSRYRGRPRGEPTRGLPPTAFVGFLQNHDQIGNRAFGERITALATAEAVRAGTAVLLLAPPIPLLFMGEEWGAAEPFLFFSDLGPDLGSRVAEGRREEFARFPEFADPAVRRRLPDPQAAETRDRSVLDWSALGRAPHQEWLAFHRGLLQIREKEITPLLADAAAPGATFRALADTALEVAWTFPGERVLRLVANLGARAVTHPGPRLDWGRRLYGLGLPGPGWDALGPWSVAVYLQDGDHVTRDG
ncbi:MAG TPA: malto-oligosyltrehalose trehalohydrolase [Methylomirabilota bacterium]|jgi:malto-oligosyltrehalose trehalohydrolase|nr:malto-oligosyltrehalose trehalohydrolase [Methylomirabilota bacterium]